MRERGVVVPVTSICRDPDDDLVLQTAPVGGAAAVVSGDADVTRDPALITALRERDVGVLTVQQFLARLEAEPSGRA